MYAAFLIFCGLVVAALLALAAREYMAHKWAEYTDAAPVSFADIRAMDDTTAFDPKPDLPRTRLRSVPIASLPSLYIVPPIDDDEWFAELLANRPAPFSVPQQRDGSAS